MDLLILLALLAIGFFVARSQSQRRRIGLLARHLGNYQIEKLMETLTQGYLRALGENDAARREQIFQLLETSESQLAGQFNSFAAEFARVDEAETRVSTLPVGLPFADRLLPQATFDLRKAFAIHAQGLADAVANPAGRTRKEKAFTVSAELFLMQHSCHWFCKSKNVASARMLFRHQTAYAQLLASVGPATRRAYGSLTGE